MWSFYFRYVFVNYGALFRLILQHPIWQRFPSFTIRLVTVIFSNWFNLRLILSFLYTAGSEIRSLRSFSSAQSLHTDRSRHRRTISDTSAVSVSIRSYTGSEIIAESNTVCVSLITSTYMWLCLLTNLLSFALKASLIMIALVFKFVLQLLTASSISILPSMLCYLQIPFNVNKIKRNMYLSESIEKIFNRMNRTDNLLASTFLFCFYYQLLMAIMCFWSDQRFLYPHHRKILSAWFAREYSLNHTQPFVG